MPKLQCSLFRSTQSQCSAKGIDVQQKWDERQSTTEHSLSYCLLFQQLDTSELASDKEKGE